METKIYKLIASLLNAIDNCKNQQNKEWEIKHTDTLKKVINLLPSGSGIDSDNKINFDESHQNKIVIDSSFHAMRDGYYERWIDYKVILTPSLAFDYNLKVQGNFGQTYSDIHEYLTDIYTNVFDLDIDSITLKISLN